MKITFTRKEIIALLRKHVEPMAPQQRIYVKWSEDHVELSTEPPPEPPREIEPPCDPVAASKAFDEMRKMLEQL
jgi:hypothetical protein